MKSNENNLEIYYEQRICAECKKSFLVRKASKNKLCNTSCAAKYKNRVYELNKKGGLKSSSLQLRRSKNEIYFASLCQDYFKSVKCNKPMFNGWDADVIIEDYKIAVLWNGIWHYKKVKQGHSVKQVQNRDEIKIKEIIKFGYTPYVIKDMGGEDKDFVKEQFLLFIDFIRNKQQ